MTIAGSDLGLHKKSPQDTQYDTEWNTTGIEPTKHGARQDITISLKVSKIVSHFCKISRFSSYKIIVKGPAGSVRKVVQTKFYEKNDSHADWGHKLSNLVIKCSGDGQGNITIRDEEFK